MSNMFVSGALAGLAGSTVILGVQHRLLENFLVNYGFEAIPIAGSGRAASGGRTCHGSAVWRAEKRSSKHADRRQRPGRHRIYGAGDRHSEHHCPYGHKGKAVEANLEGGEVTCCMRFFPGFFQRISCPPAIRLTLPIFLCGNRRFILRARRCSEHRVGRHDAQRRLRFFRHSDTDWKPVLGSSGGDSCRRRAWADPCAADRNARLATRSSPRLAKTCLQSALPPLLTRSFSALIPRSPNAKRCRTYPYRDFAIWAALWRCCSARISCSILRY